MKRTIISISVIFCCIHLQISAAETKLTISAIITGLETYKNRPIEMEFRLKYLDRTFEKIVFYDSDNNDIEFDISGFKVKKNIANDLLNIHEGMLYIVKFTVTGIGNTGGLVAELIGFKPSIIDRESIIVN